MTVKLLTTQPGRYDFEMQSHGIFAAESHVTCSTDLVTCSTDLVTCSTDNVTFISDCISCSTAPVTFAR